MKSGCSFGRLAIPSNTSRYSVKLGGRAKPGRGLAGRGTILGEGSSRGRGLVGEGSSRGRGLVGGGV